MSPGDRRTVSGAGAAQDASPPWPWADPGVLGQAFVDASLLAVIGVDLAGRLWVVNPAAETLLGVRSQDVLGEGFRVLLPRDSADETSELVQQAGRGEFGHLELSLQGSDGPVEVGISFAPLHVDGQLIGSFGVVRDISVRKGVEHHLRAYAESFRALSASSELGMYRFAFDPDWRVDHVNPAFCDMIGVSLEELQADPSPLNDRIPVEARERFIANRFGPGEPDWPLEFDYLRADGRTVTLSVHEVAIRERSGRVSVTLGIGRDVTAQRRQEQALTDALALEREAAEQLRRVDDLRRLFLQAVSHELRTPLTAVLGFAATLRDRRDDLGEATISTLTDRLHVQASRLERLLDDLLDIERSGLGIEPLGREPVDLGDLIRQVVEEVGDSSVVVDAGSLLATVDRSKVERIVSNLLTNARKHAGSDAVVRVDVAARAGTAMLTVDDDGPGIPEEFHERVFEPFTRGPGGGEDASPGTGIGLALVARFAQLHGGRASVGSSPLGGARFLVELPLMPPDRQEVADADWPGWTSTSAGARRPYAGTGSAHTGGYADRPGRETRR